LNDNFTNLAGRLDALADNDEALLAELLTHEETLRVQRFDLGDAWELGVAIRELGASHALPIAISIMLGRHRAFHAALPGAVADNDSWAARKIAVVPATDFAAHGGAFPIALDAGGTLLGVASVSGLPSAHDHAMVTTVLAQRLGRRVRH
jgi:uncharacterized protein (UPF0303 family)